MTSLGAFLRRPASERSLAGFVLFRLRFAVGALILVFIVATVGYIVLEHYSALDGAFMTVITLSTVGYGEVRPLNAIGRLFTIGVIIAGFGTLAYAGAVLTTVFTSGEIAGHLRNARITRMRHAMRDHVIVVGYGRVGQAAARAVNELGHPCLVMERNADLEPQISEAGFAVMIGDATDEADLREAGLDEAMALIAAAEEDAVNLIVTLTVRALRPDLRIVSRVNESTWQDRILRAGASVAQSPYRSYGLSLAGSAISAAVLEMHAIPVLGMITEEIQISRGSELVGQRLDDVVSRESGVLVIGVRRDRLFHRWDEVDGTISTHDVLIALGTPLAVEALARRA